MRVLVLSLCDPVHARAILCSTYQINEASVWNCACVLDCLQGQCQVTGTPSSSWLHTQDRNWALIWDLQVTYLAWNLKGIQTGNLATCWLCNLLDHLSTEPVEPTIECYNFYVLGMYRITDHPGITTAIYQCLTQYAAVDYWAQSLLLLLSTSTLKLSSSHSGKKQCSMI